MALPKPMHEDHEVLGEDYCPGYVDAYGSWNNGFPCPALSPLDPPVHCCGTSTHKYCCSADTSSAATAGADNARLPLLLGVLLGAVVAVTVVIVVSCLHCSCCLLYKKRQPSNTGPMYQLQGGTTGVTGVANMYSFSRATTPQCSLSRSSSMRSVTSSDSNQHSLSSLRHPGEPLNHHLHHSSHHSTTSPFAPHFQHFPTSTITRHNQHHHYQHQQHPAPRSDCGSLISSLSSSATPSDGTTREIVNNGRMTIVSNLPPVTGVGASPLSELPPPYSLNPQAPGLSHAPSGLSHTASGHSHAGPGLSRVPSELGHATSSSHVGGPPPSTLVAVRTTSNCTVGHQQPSRHPHSSGSSSAGSRLAGARTIGDVFVVGTGENGCVTGMFSTFTQSPTSPSTTMTTTIRNNNNNLTVAALNDNAVSNDSENPFLGLVNRNNINIHRASNFNNSNGNFNSNSVYNTNDTSYITNPEEVSTRNGITDAVNRNCDISCVTPPAMHRLTTNNYNALNQTAGGGVHGGGGRGLHHHQEPQYSVQDKCGNVSPVMIKSSHEGNFKSGHPQKGGGHAPPTSFSPALTPTTRPCSTAHIINTAHNGEEGTSSASEHETRLFSATKF